MAYRDRYALEPLRIRANLRSAVVADEFMPLDGVLLYQAHRELGGTQVVTIPGAYTINGVSTLPLAIEHPGRRNWYYRCSWAQWGESVEGTDYWNKRFDSQYADVIDWDGKRGKVIVEQGKYKAYHQPIFYRAALWVEWYCVGDKNIIERLLCTVSHMGKKRSQGWGRVASWKIESWPEDWSIWRSDGRLMRGIPLEDARERRGDGPYDFMYYGIRPSYWNKSNQKALVKPDG